MLTNLFAGSLEQNPTSISATASYSGSEGSLLVAVEHRITLYSSFAHPPQPQHRLFYPSPRRI
jgi:hypothetical protein